VKVALLTGGTSSERDVALASGLQIAGALRERGHDVDVVDLATGFVPRGEEQALLPGGVGREPPPLAKLKALEKGMLTGRLAEIPVMHGADVVFLALHGGQGEDGTLQALLDVMDITYTGSGHLAAALAMDKDVSKRVLRDAGVGVAEWIMAPADARRVGAEVGFPCVVKPSREGSSVGLTLVRDPGDLPAAIGEARAWDTEVMIERFIEGRELTVGILGDQTLPVIEIIARHELFDYECKYTPGMAEEFPAELPAALDAELKRQAMVSHRALKLGGYSRVDFRVTPGGGIFCLEANTLPGMTANSLIPKAARAAGISFPDLCEAICRLALAGRGNKR
jgi:D-alanine-D-alanine ligase